MLSTIIIILFVISAVAAATMLDHSIQDSKKFNERRKRAYELFRRIDEANAAKAKEEAEARQYEEPEPVYGRLIDDGNSVLTNDGEVIRIIKSKEGE